VYIVWIPVVTIANITAVLVINKWDGFGLSEQMWTILVMCIASIITLLVLVRRKDYAYSAVIIWALVGIFIKRSADDPLYGVQTQIAFTALFFCIFLLISSLFIFIFSQRKGFLQLK
jgi:hypothetical protein